MRCFSNQLPVNYSRWARWCSRQGESGSEEILKSRVETRPRAGVASAIDFKDFSVDAVAQNSDIRYPPERRSCHRVLERSAKMDCRGDVVIRQNPRTIWQALVNDAGTLRTCASDEAGEENPTQTANRLRTWFEWLRDRRSEQTPPPQGFYSSPSVLTSMSEAIDGRLNVHSHLW